VYDLKTVPYWTGWYTITVLVFGNLFQICLAPLCFFLLI
jgi:hypothetical protein